jgi:peptide/nickel transport system ATP-binding protein
VSGSASGAGPGIPAGIPAGNPPGEAAGLPPTVDAPPALEMRDVHVTYRGAGGEIPAVRGVDLVLPAGASLGVAGESGSGKSTLMSTVLRLQPKSALVTGQVLVDGEDVLAMSFKRLRALRWAQASIVFQGALHGLNPLQRIGDQIAEPITLHDRAADEAAARSRVGELLEQVGLPASRARSYPHQLSGGQRQRVMIAMALACRPRLIVADEPTTALDVMVQAQVLRVLSDLVEQLGLTLVLISHDLSVLADTCQQAAVMYAGQVVELGPASEVFERSAHPYSRALAAAFPRVGDPRFRYAPSGLAGDPPYPGEVGAGCAFAPRCPVARADCVTGTVVLEAVESGRRAACRYPLLPLDRRHDAGAGGGSVGDAGAGAGAAASGGESS